MNKHTGDIPLWTGLQGNLNNVAAVICDLWGVLHDGVVAYDDAVDCLIKLRSHNIPVALLSNSPKPISAVWDHLAGLGISRDVADTLVTSGSLARRLIRRSFNGQKMYHLGPSERDALTLQDLPVEIVKTANCADFILCTGLDEATAEAHRPFLIKAARDKKKMICANPDRVVHIRGKLHLCAGVVADIYEELGGQVEWAGKPNAKALHAALDALEIGSTDKTILMIGDSLQTDMAGAVNAGFQGLLIAGGIHRNDLLPIVMNDALGYAMSYADLATTLERPIHDLPSIKAIMPQLKW